MLPRHLLLKQLQNKSVIFWVCLFLVSSLAVALRLPLLNKFLLSYDEAIHLVWLRLLTAGYKPYTEVYITYPPLYPLSIQAIWEIWPSEAAQRWFSVAYALFGAVPTALLAQRMAGDVAGLVAAALLLFSPILVEPSRAVLGEFHSVAWSIWAVWFIVCYQQAVTPARRSTYLILSGLSIAASLLTKLLSPFLVVLLVGVIVTRHRQQVFQIKPLLRDLSLWSLAVIGPVLLFMGFLFNLNELFYQTITQRLLARQAYLIDSSTVDPTSQYLATFFREDSALVILGLIGVILLWLKHRAYFWLLAGWFLLAVAFLTVHYPLRYKHFLVFVPILAILGSLTVAGWLKLLLQRKKVSVYAVGGLLLLLLIYAEQIPATLTRWETQAEQAHPPANEAQMLAFIEEVLAPDDCLVTDDMPFLYWSGRMTPPEFAEMSANRLISGSLPLVDLIDISNQSDCQVVAPIANRIPKYMPDYMTWVETHYLGRTRYGEDDLFFGKIDTVPRPEMPQWADFNGELAFHGYTLPAGISSPGSRIPIKLIWQTQQRLSQDYTIFVQLRDDQGVTLAGADYQPYKGLAPFSEWPAGATIQTMTWLTLPSDLPEAAYQIYVGLYDPKNLERLPLRGDTSGENALILGPLPVGLPTSPAE